MKLKDAIIIAAISCALVGGAITGIVGGAGGMVALASVIHIFADAPNN